MTPRLTGLLSDDSDCAEGDLNNVGSQKSRTNGQGAAADEEDNKKIRTMRTQLIQQLAQQQAQQAIRLDEIAQIAEKRGEWLKERDSMIRELEDALVKISKKENVRITERISPRAETAIKEICSEMGLNLTVISPSKKMLKTANTGISETQM